MHRSWIAVALNPSTEKITTEAYIAVRALVHVMKITSFTQLFLGLLYDPNAMRDPKANPKE